MIGVTLVLADGTVARSGGHVIKNVAGYDLAKLVNGSLGSLALVAEVVVRLHPRPETSTTTAAATDAEQATRAVLASAASPLEPVAVEWVSDGDSGRLYVRMDGTRSYVDDASERLAELLAGFALAATPLSADEAETAWQDHGSGVIGADDETVVRICGLPSDLGRLVTDAFQAARQAGLDAHIVSSAALGMHTVRFHGGTPQDHAAAFTGLRDRALAQGASVLLRNRAPQLDDLVDVLGPKPSSAEILRRVKEQFDPSGRCAPGRFQPWY